jgi:hypothetical protein
LAGNLGREKEISDNSKREERGGEFWEREREGVWLGGVAEQKTDFEREKERESESVICI